MKKVTWLLAIALVIVMMAPAFAAPLFPDVPEQHWARDAVADLAAKGILEGYPDGTFKGDRAATRWEMAMALQRFLAKMEAEHAKFATKADLEALRALVNNLKDELDALGVRVKNLEENVSALDKRVTELERITFEGDFVTRFVTIGIKNSGRTGTNWNTDVGGIGGVDVLRGHKVGTIDLFNGRPLINGAGFTAKARLGVNVKVSKDIKAGIRFAAFTSLGDQYVDAYWGVSAPYLSNVFAGNGFGTSQSMTNAGWTRMTLDNFWMEHIPSGTKLIVGAIEKTKMDDFIVHPVNNPGIDGRDRLHFADMAKEKKDMVSTVKYYENEDGAYLPFYGLQVAGRTHLITDMDWEVMYSKMPTSDSDVAVGSGNVNQAVPYLFTLVGGWKIKDQGMVKLNFARISENFSNGQNTATIINHGNYFGWTDPYDRRNDAANKQPMRGALNSISQQGQTMWGISINYRFDPSNIRVVAAYGGSDYKPNQESGYSVNGSHFRLGVGWTDKDNKLDLDLEYLSTDPYYDAFQLYYQPVGFMSQGGLGNATAIGACMLFPNVSYPNFGYQLHDSDLYPNNRQGIRFNGEYRFSNGNGRVNLRLGFLTQSEDSSPHRDIGNTFNGFKPGFIDPIFGVLADNNGIGNAARVYESPKGKQNQFGGGVEYAFKPTALKANVQYDYYDFTRDSDPNTGNAALNRNISMLNRVDMKYSALRIGLDYAFSDKFSLRGGWNMARVQGYHYALWDQVNQPTANAGDNVVKQVQSMPYLGFDYDIGKDTRWSADVRMYNTTDELGRNFSGNSKESFDGVQFMTQFKVKF